MNNSNLDPMETFVKILVIGVGGAGSNAVNRMIDEKIRGVNYCVCNTDAQDLALSKAENRIILGRSVTNGLGAGGNPEVGHAAAEDSAEELYEVIQGMHLVIIAAGMGGGTGTGAAPVIARIAKDCGALTLAFVTRPFEFEGEKRRINAVEGIRELKENVDSIMIVSNERLLIVNGSCALEAAFASSDEVLYQSVRTITDIITIPGIINLDFSDVRSILNQSGRVLIGNGIGKGEHKAKDAAAAALACPLLELPIQGARRMLINVTISPGAALDDVREIVQTISAAAGEVKNVIFGAQRNSELEDTIIASVIATDFENDADPSVEPLIQPTVTINNTPVDEEEERDSIEDNDILPSFFGDNKKD